MIPQFVNYLNRYLWLNISIYLVLIVLIFVVTTSLSNFCVILKQKLHLTDGVIAGIIMSIITSLPELVTCITTIIINKKGSIGVGDVIGSNIFDFTTLSIFLLIGVYFFSKQKINKINTVTLAFCFASCIIVWLGMITDKYFSWLTWHGFNFWSLVLFVAYIFCFYLIFKDQKDNRQVDAQKLIKKKNNYFNNLKAFWLILIIITLSLVLLLISILISDASISLIFNHWQINETFGGALLLGVSTSLPEIICCISFAQKKEYNMLISTMVGSCCFNFFILSLSNIVLSFIWEVGNLMYAFDKYSIIQILVLTIIICLFGLYFYFNRHKNINNKNRIIGVNIFLLILIILVFITYIFVNLTF